MVIWRISNRHTEVILLTVNYSVYMYSLSSVKVLFTCLIYLDIILRESVFVVSNQHILGATFSFDAAAVCFATSSGGPVWAVLYYSANLMFTCIGPMVRFFRFLY